MVIQKIVDIAMFPGTYSSYDVTSYPETILIPGPIDIDKKIPCFLFIPRDNLQIMVIYAHANGVDIGEIHGRLRYVSERLRINILLFDYPGYGKHEGRSDESNVDLCMSILINFVTQELNWPIENIVLWGCSIGTGPSTRQAKILSEQKRRLGGLILQCPYKSIKHAAESLAGKIGRLLITQRWNIQSEILDCSCPVLWIHGKKDSLFNWIGSYEMYESYHINLRSCHFPKEATHHFFDIEIDIIQPIQQFLNKFVSPNLVPIYDRDCIKNGRKTKLSIFKAYNSKLNPFRPTVLDVYLTRNTNIKLSKENGFYGEKKFVKEMIGHNKMNEDEDVNNNRVVGPKDIKSILNFWGNNNKNKEIFSSILKNQLSSLYLEGDFVPKYIWLNGEAGEYITQLEQQTIKSKSSSSIYLSSSGEDEFEESINEEFDEEFDDDADSNQDDLNSNEEFKCYSKLVNSNLISSNQMYYKNIKQCVSYNNVNTNVYSVYNNNFHKNQRIEIKKRNVMLNNPTVFRLECRKRMEKLKFKSFTKNEELLLNFWPITNLYCYLFDQYSQFFQIVLSKIKQGNFSFLNNSKDTFLSIIMWVRRLYYLYTPTLFMNSVYSYKPEKDEWVLDGISIGNIYIQLQNINGINGRIVARLLDKSPIFKCFPPPFNIIIPLYAPPKPFFQPIAEWVVRTIYRLHVYNTFKSSKSIKLNSNVTQKYPNIDSYKDPMNHLETICLLEELSFSSLQHFLLCSTRPKIEKLALITGFGNWIPFGWNEFIIKIFESNSKHFLQRILFFNNQNSFSLIGSDFIKLLVPFYLPSFVNMYLIYRIIKTKIKTRNEWISTVNNKANIENHEISNLIHPEMCNNIFNNIMNVINTSVTISNGFLVNNQFLEKELQTQFLTQNHYILTNKQLNWEAILKDFDSFSAFMSLINFSSPKLFLPGISQLFRGKTFDNFPDDSVKRDSSDNIEDKSELSVNYFIKGIEQNEFKENDKTTEELIHDYASSDFSYDKIESPEQPAVRSFQRKIVLMNNEANNNNGLKNSNFDDNFEDLNTDFRSKELPLTWESVFFNSKDPLLIINQLQHHDRIYMGMSPSNYVILHQLLYEKYSFLRLNRESEYIFRLLWHFSHCCIYHGNLLNSSNKNKDFPYSTIHPLQCLLLIVGVLRKAIDNPSNSDLSQLNWLDDVNEKQYTGFNSSCYISSSNNKLNIIERILAISVELIENGVCNQLINYSINSNIKNVSFELGKDIDTSLKKNENEMEGLKNLKIQNSELNNNSNFEPEFEICNDDQKTEGSILTRNIQKKFGENFQKDLLITQCGYSSSDSSISSRISSFESLINRVYDGKMNNGAISNNYERLHKVLIYSTTKMAQKITQTQKEMKLIKKTIPFSKQIKEARIVGLNGDYIGTIKQFSPIIIKNDGVETPRNEILGNKSQKKILKKVIENKNTCELNQRNKSPNKLKMLAYSSLKIFKK